MLRRGNYALISLVVILIGNLLSAWIYAGERGETRLTQARQLLAGGRFKEARPLLKKLARESEQTPRSAPLLHF